MWQVAPHGAADREETEMKMVELSEKEEQLIMALRYADIGPQSALYETMLWWKDRSDGMYALGFLEDARMSSDRYYRLAQKFEEMRRNNNEK